MNTTTKGTPFDAWDRSDKTICFLLPTNKESEVEAIGKAIDFAKEQGVTCNAVFAVDGDIGIDLIFKYSNTPGLHFVQVGFEDTGGETSMMKLRHAALCFAVSEGLGDWPYIIDGDMALKDGWLSFIIETIRMLPVTMLNAGFGCWVNFRGFFGSSGPGDKLLIPRQLPLGSNLGILLNNHAARFMYQEAPAPLPGGCEDPLITTWLTLRLGCIPFRRFKMPAHHPKKATEHYSKSFIHDKSVIWENNFRLMKMQWDNAAKNIGLTPKLWGGIPDNADQTGKAGPNGAPMSASYPLSEKIVVHRVKEIADAGWGDEIKEYVNWTI